MKIAFVLLALVSTNAFAGTNLEACKETLGEKAKLVEMMDDEFNKGIISSTEVAIAKLDLLVSRFECRDILFSEFCEIAKPLASKVLKGAYEEFQIGERSSTELSRIQVKEAEIVGLCR